MDNEKYIGNPRKQSDYKLGKLSIPSFDCNFSISSSRVLMARAQNNTRIYSKFERLRGARIIESENLYVDRIVIGEMKNIQKNFFNSFRYKIHFFKRVFFLKSHGVT